MIDDSQMTTTALPPFRDVAVLAATGVTLALATIALFLRLLSRRMANVRFWWDDYFEVIAWAFATAFSSLIVICQWQAHTYIHIER